MNYRENDATPPEVHREPPGGLGSVGCLSLFVGIPAAGILVNAFRAGPILGAIASVVIFAIGVAVYAFFNEDATVTIDDRAMRMTHRRFLFGVPGPVKVAWEIPLAKLTGAREVTYHSPAKNGGWTRSKKLHLPTGIALEPAVLGGEHSSTTTYGKLVASLERRLGSAFTREDDFGPLTAAMKRGEISRPPGT